MFKQNKKDFQENLLASKYFSFENLLRKNLEKFLLKFFV